MLVMSMAQWNVDLLRGARAIDAMVMALALARAPMDGHVGRRFFAAVAIYGASILVFAFSTDFIVAMVALAVSGAADMVSIVVRQTLVQLETPDEMRGRVSAVNATFISTSNQLGEFRAGATAAWLGPTGAAGGRRGRH